MNLDEHPYLSIYLVGCVVAFCLALVVTVEAHLVSWIAKGNVFRKNLNKIKDPASTGFKMTAGMFVFGLVSGTIMSWLGVLQYLWQIFWIPLSVLRDAFAPVPEEVKLLRFPLMNNPDLSREAVFAYLYALGVRAGTRPDAWQMANELEEIGGYYPSFNSEVALQTLGSLGAVDQEMLSEALARVKASKEEEADW